jgi:hypothetical protein
VSASFAVVVGLNDPHEDPPHVTAHVTCGFAVTSLVIPALIENCAPACNEAGGAAKNETAIGIGGTIVIVVDADRLVSATDVAVTVTVDPAGIAAGAVYVTAPPSGLALKAPHPLGVPHVTAYVTAEFSLLPATGYVAAASSVAEAFTASDVGGAATKITAVGFTTGGVTVKLLPGPAHPLKPTTRPKPGRRRPILPPIICVPRSYCTMQNERRATRHPGPAKKQGHPAASRKPLARFLLAASPNRFSLAAFR